MRGVVVSCFCFMEQCAVMWAVWFAGGVVRERHGVSGKEWNPMRKTGRGLKEWLLLPVLAVAVVAVLGCKGVEPDAVAEPLLPTGAPEADDDETQKEASRTLPEYELTVENELYFEFAYEYETLTVRSENPDIVQAKLMEGEYDYEENRETTGVMLYGIANGTTELVVTDVTSGQEVRWKVTVEKPDTESGKQKLIDWLLANGESNDIGDKELAEGKVEKGKLIGHSTDAEGFLGALNSAKIPLKGNVLILGCGGAARTIATECAKKGLNITLAVRESSIKKATILANEIESHFDKAVPCTNILAPRGKFDLAVNCTPVGMHPNINESPLPAEALKNIPFVFDAVYNPRDTLLIKTALSLGKTAVSGMGMLVMQAAKAHEFWYGATFKNKDILDLIKDANNEMRRLFNE